MKLRESRMGNVQRSDSMFTGQFSEWSEWSLGSGLSRVLRGQRIMIKKTLKWFLLSTALYLAVFRVDVLFQDFKRQLSSIQCKFVSVVQELSVDLLSV